jgi:hypothetical protein
METQYIRAVFITDIKHFDLKKKHSSAMLFSQLSLVMAQTTES